MPEITPNKKYTLPYETEAVDINVINENFRKDDGFPYVKEAGTAYANRYLPGSTSNVAEKLKWYYKIWSHGIVEAYAVAHVTAMICNDSQKQDGTWRSNYFRFNYPTFNKSLDTVFHRTAWISGADDGTSGYWLEDVSTPKEGNDDAAYQTVRGVSTKKETTARDKNIYVGFMATLKQ